MSKDKDKKQVLSVIIETPKGSRNKYVYDKKAKGFRLKKILPVGAVFPYDFGFIPGTKGQDGDPLDILLLMDEAAFPGCIVECRIVGALKAKQSEGKEMLRNDRIIGISTQCSLYKDITDISQLNPQLLQEISHFFVSYNEQEGKTFEPRGWVTPEEALKIIYKGR